MAEKSIQITDVYLASSKNGKKVPSYSGVAAGFPSPADDFLEDKLDLNEKLIQHPAATFFVRVSGHSMIKAGIHSGDLLIVDRSLEPQTGNVVVAVIDGEFTVKRILKKGDQIYLIPENSKFKPIKISDDSNFQVWGVVTNVIHTV